MNIPYGRQYIDDDDIKAVVEVLKSDYLTTGPNVTEFEEAVKAYTGAKYAVAVSNGTAALHAACYAAGVAAGDEVITTPITFAASANCALYLGAKPVFADIDPITWNISPEDIERKITPKTKAIVAVDYTGEPCDMDEINRIAGKHGIVVIEDAAHALGSVYKGRNTGTTADITEFSFHPVKHITSGEGGMIVTNDKAYYKRAYNFRTHGIVKNPDCFVGVNEGGWYHEQQELGYNYRITDIQCALGRSQLNKLPMFLARRKELVANYNRAFADEELITTPFEPEWCESARHLYVIKVPSASRRQIYDYLQAAGIHVNVHYIPVYKHPYYQNNGYKDVVCKNAEELYSGIISIPLYYGLTDDEQGYVIEKVKEAVKKFN